MSSHKKKQYFTTIYNHAHKVIYNILYSHILLLLYSFIVLYSTEVSIVGDRAEKEELLGRLFSRMICVDV